MRANFENINSSQTSSLLYRYYKQTVGDIIPLHFHPEYEITYVAHGKGKRIAGGQTDYFEPGDLILINSNIPHCWLYENRENDPIENFVIQFKEDLIFSNFIDLPEFKSIKKMFENMKTGYVLKGGTMLYVKDKMLKMSGMNEFNRLMTLFDILQKISLSTDSVSVDGFMNPLRVSAADMSKFQKVYTYIINNYRNPVSLETAAGETAMSTTAFCRFFKKISRKTFMEFLCEYRIEAACKLLRETEKSVWDICFLCGFSDPPHFNRTFKKIKEISPLQYRKRHN